MTIAAIAGWFGGQLLAGIGLVVWLVVEGTTNLQDQAALMARIGEFLPQIMLLSALGAVAALALLWLLDGLPERPPQVAPGRAAAIVVGAGAACIAAQAAISWLLGLLGRAPAQEQDVIASALQGDERLLVALALVVLAPLGEELTFRRVGYSALARPWGRPLAALVTALAFAVFHGHPPAIPNYVVIALCCTLAYEKTGRAAVPIAVHALNNAVAVGFNLA